MKKVLSLLSLLALGVVGMNAQTDVTSQYLQNADLSSLNGWNYSSYTDWRTDASVPVIEWFDATKTVRLTQDVTLPAGSYRFVVGAFYREGSNGNGTNTKVYLQVGDDKQFVHALTADEFSDINGSKYSGSNDLYRAANAFSKGDFSNTLDFTVSEEQTLTLGISGIINTSSTWVAIGAVKLYSTSKDDLLNTYRDKVAEAEALYEKPMNAGVLSELRAAVVAESTLTTSEEVLAAIDSLSAAIEAAKASVKGYEQVKNLLTIAYDYAEKCYANGAPQSSETDALNAIQTAYDNRTIDDTDAAIAEINNIMMAIGQSQTSWQRIEPAMPRTQTLESGKIYYLYNVGSDRFLTYGYTSSYGDQFYVKTNEGVPVKLSAVNGTEYTIQDVNNGCYLYSYYSNDIVRYSSNSNDYSVRFTITEVDGGYTIQRVQNSVETEFLGYNDNTYNVLYSNLTTGNIVWQLFDPDEAARFIAKRNLYRALVSADGYSIDDWELVYDLESSSNYELQDAADELNDAVSATNKFSAPDWSDYNVLFYAENLWDNWYDPANYSNQFYSKDIKNGSRILRATVDVDDDATLAFNYNKYCNNSRRGVLEVYLDDVLQFSVNGYEGKNNQRYFVEMMPGKHKITWKFVNDDNSNTAYCYINNIGVEQTPTIIVSLLEPGSLGTEVLAQTDHIQNVRKLIISGEMNDDDWSRILMMTSIFSLDLTNVTNTEIPEKALSRYYHSDNLAFLHEVKLPIGLKVLGDYALDGTYLSEITFPEGLTTIGKYAFSSSRIKEAMIPEGVTSVGEGAFQYNETMTKASYPAASVSVPDYCFSDCNVLETFVLPEGITSIGNRAFYDCWWLDTPIPSTVSSIGESAFYYSAIKNVVISENATVGSNAFQDCFNLTTVVLPTTFYDDVYRMLGGCGNLRDVTFKSPTMVLTGSDFFYNNTLSNITLHVPNYLVNTYKQDNYWYNCNVVGFSTLDIQDWIVNQPLKMSAGQRFEGTPNVKLMGAGTWEIKGDDAMTLNNLETDYYNASSYYNRGFVKNSTTQILSTCDNITITGDYKHYHYTPANTWFFVTLPFDAKVGDIGSGSSFAVRYYDGANRAENGTGGNWKNYKKDDVIPAGTGFIFQTSQDVWSSFKAQDNETKQRVFSNEMISTSLQVNASEQKEHKGWNLVGNPWMTYYNIHKMNFTAPITCWDPYNRSYTAYSVYDDDYAIKPLEAFFVQCPSEELTTIEFPIDGRQLTDVIESQNAARAAAQSERKLIDVELSLDGMTDKTRFVMNPQAAMDYELQCDASKFFSMDASVPQIYTIEQGVQLAINERPMGDGTVQLGLRLAQDGEYTITAPRNQFQNIVLVDNETGIETDLSNSEGYAFSADKGTDESRFVLRVGGVVVTAVQSVAIAQQQTEQAYNLQGQRVAAPQKGLYIVNGKKIMK